jgi:hypothetical protein
LFHISKVRLSVKSSNFSSYYLFAAIFITLAILSVIFKDPIKTQLNAWDFLPKQEPVTELYFTDPDTIPNEYTPGSNIETSITIHNATAKPMFYTYVMSQQSSAGDNTIQLTKGVVSIPVNVTKNIPLHFTPVEQSDRAKFDIHVLEVDQHINFWANKKVVQAPPGEAQDEGPIIIKDAQGNLYNSYYILEQ